MSESKENNNSNFNSKEEAFEYLVQQSQNQALKDQWRKELDQLPDSPTLEKSKTRVLFLKKVIGVAASLIFMFGCFFWFSQSNDTLQQMASNLIDETYFVLESDSFTRGVDESQNDNLTLELQKEINSALERKDYQQAIGLFMTKEKKSQLSLVDKFYYSLSLARIEGGDYYKAIRLLDDVTKKKDEFYDEALWLQALLYLRVNEPNQSKIILNKLINKSNYQITNTKALLQRMAN